MNGLYERYEEGGQLIVKALYKDGEKHGLYEYYQDDGVIDTSYDDVNTGDQIFIDVEGVTLTTPPKGLSVVLTFE